MEFLKDIIGLLRERKKWWLFPMVLILLVIGALIVLTNGSAVAPFVYTFF